MRRRMLAKTRRRIKALTGQQLQISGDFGRRLLDYVRHAASGHGRYGHDHRDRGSAADEYRTDLPPNAWDVVEPETKYVNKYRSNTPVVCENKNTYFKIVVRFRGEGARVDISLHPW